MSGSKYTPQIILRAQELLDRGFRWSRVAARLGVSEDGLRRRLDARYRETRNERRRQSRGYGVRSDGARLSESAFEAAITGVPPDTRSLTSRALGDPLPGRSALDKRNIRIAAITCGQVVDGKTRTYSMEDHLSNGRVV